jgi:hypothetical protein
MPTIDLTDAEHAALVALIRRAIEEARAHASTRCAPPWRSSTRLRRRRYDGP